jgi:hypothetical protein
MNRAILFVAAVAALAGCTTQSEPFNMAYTCQTTKCICEATKVKLFRKPETVPVLWAQTGEAYCPENFVLQIADEELRRKLKKR